MNRRSTAAALGAILLCPMACSRNLSRDRAADLIRSARPPEAITASVYKQQDSYAMFGAAKPGSIWEHNQQVYGALEKAGLMLNTETHRGEGNRRVTTFKRALTDKGREFLSSDARMEFSVRACEVGFLAVTGVQNLEASKAKVRYQVGIVTRTLFFELSGACRRFVEPRELEAEFGLFDDGWRLVG